MQPLEVGAQLGGRLATELAVFLQQLIEDVLELFRELGVEGDWRDGWVIEDLIEDYRGGGAAKWMVASGHLIEHNAQRKEVAARIERLAASLLRRHVGYCTGGRA